MGIPDFQTLMLPLLELSADNREHSFREARENLATKFSLTEAEINQLLPGGSMAAFANRVGWAKTYLTQAGLLTATKRAHFTISERGKSVLGEKPRRIDVAFLDRFPEFVSFRKSRPKNSDTTVTASSAVSGETPEEQLEQAYGTLKQSIEAELLAQIKKASPKFFETLVRDLLERMGYGIGKVTGRSGDEGIDGVIEQDPLGLDVVYLQAKRWEANIGRPRIQEFVGALAGKKAKKGVFLTTSSFSPDAIAYAAGLESKVRLIDGSELVDLMLKHSLGVREYKSYSLKKIDQDYFDEEME